MEFQQTYDHCPVLLSGSPYCNATPAILPDWCLPAMQLIDGQKIMEIARLNNHKMGTISDRKGTKFAADLKADETWLFSSLQHFTICKDNKIANMIFERKPSFQTKVIEESPDHDLPW